MAEPSQHLRFTHPDLDFWVDVTVHERDERYMANADLAEDSRDVGVGVAPQEAARAALRSLGELYASDVIKLAQRSDGPHRHDVVMVWSPPQPRLSRARSGSRLRAST